MSETLLRAASVREDADGLDLVSRAQLGFPAAVEAVVEDFVHMRAARSGGYSRALCGFTVLFTESTVVLARLWR